MEFEQVSLLNRSYEFLLLLSFFFLRFYHLLYSFDIHRRLPWQVRRSFRNLKIKRRKTYKYRHVGSFFVYLAHAFRLDFELAGSGRLHNQVWFQVLDQRIWVFRHFKLLLAFWRLFCFFASYFYELQSLFVPGDVKLFRLKPQTEFRSFLPISWRLVLNIKNSQIIGRKLLHLNISSLRSLIFSQTKLILRFILITCSSSLFKIQRNLKLTRFFISCGQSVRWFFWL